MARVYDGIEQDKSANFYRGLRNINLAILKQPGTNVVAVVDAIRTLLPTFREQLPPSVLLDVRTDRSASIRESVHDVKMTLWLTFVLVVAVIFIFLRSVTATIISSLTLPVTMVATFAVMYLLNYSLDNLSLMALTLSVGFVVDNTIVMLENIVRHMEMGKTPHARGVRRLEGSGLHHRGDDRVAGGDLHPGPLHGRPRRPAARRVRRHDRRGDHRVGVRLDQPHADAVQPVPEAAAQPAAMAGSTT